MKVRYIIEGVFKTKEQMLKAREKEREMSNQERVAGTFNKIIGEKIAFLIKEAVKKKGIYPFQSTMFSTGEYYDEVKTSKKDVAVRLADENGKQVIHLSFDYGCFIPSIKNGKPCKDINVNGWVLNDYNVCNKLIREEALKSMVTKIKNFAASRGEEILGKENRDICGMVVDGDIVIDEISMYDNQDNVEELNFVVRAPLHIGTTDNFISKNRRTAWVREMNQSEGESTNSYKVILERVMKLVDFKVPVNLTVEITSVNNTSSTMTVAIDKVFPGYKTWGDIEEAAGVPEAIAECILSYFKFNERYYKEGVNYDREQIQELAKNCTHIMFDFEDAFKGRYTPDKGFILDKAEKPYIKDVTIAIDSAMRYNSKFYVNFNFIKYSSSTSLHVSEYNKDKDDTLSFSAFSSENTKYLGRRIRNFTIRMIFGKNDSNFKNVKTLANFIETDLLGPAM
jgi:ASC-1-like (ASCH) protein